MRANNMAQTFFEATTEQKRMATIGRSMMDWSEEYGKMNGLKAVTDDGLRTLNELSHVGNMLTHFGAPYGTREADFKAADRKLIVEFVNKTLVVERKDNK
jgi:hypothetical protein